MILGIVGGMNWPSNEEGKYDKMRNWPLEGDYKVDRIGFKIV